MKTRLMVAFGFLAAIAAGTALLALPCASATGQSLAFSDALFTACSATCITGLSVIDVGSALSPFGQGVLLFLVQLGCVGIMTVTTFFLVCAGKSLSLSGEFSLSDAYGVTGIRGIRALVVWVLSALLTVELLGMCALYPALHDWRTAFFYSAMAFCNAGFSLSPDSLAFLAHAPGALVTLAALVVLGGFGFLVLYNIVSIRFWRRDLVKRRRFSLHTRVVLIASAVFTLVLFAAMLALESRHGAFEGFSGGECLAGAFFQSVTPRTCGFSVVPVEALHPATRFLTMVFMFIGAAPGGAGGGIKVTTFVVFLATMLAICRHRNDTAVGRRSLPESVVRQAIVILFVFAAFVTAAVTALLLTEQGSPLTFEQLLFEAVSAVSTTGLSMGDTTASLSQAGRIVVMLCMFVGRLGALALVLMLSGGRGRSPVNYPKEELVVG